MSQPCSFRQHHAVRVRPVGRGPRAHRSMYKLYCYAEDGAAQLVEPVFEYVLEQMGHRSVKWQELCVRAIGLFIDFTVANRALLEEENGTQVLQRWVQALFDGTIPADGIDRSGLYWRGRHRPHVETLLNTLTAFADWLTARHGASPLNPWRNASLSEQLVQARARERRSARSILGHLQAPSMRGRVRSVVAPGQRLTVQVSNPTAFDESKIWDLLFTGMRRRGRFHPEHERLHLPAVLLTIAMHGGGLRCSELLHAYVDDVLHDPLNPSSCQVRLYHPEQGWAPPSHVDALNRRITTHRTGYLRERWGWQPRTHLADRFAVGFKGLLLSNSEENYADVHWFPSAWGEVFKYFFDLYIRHQRSRHCPHPFLLVSQRGRQKNEPYTLGAYKSQYKVALARIGLQPGLGLGNSPHAHRHAYGQRLAASKVDPLLIQRAMHHRSVESQEAYTGISTQRASIELAQAEQRWMQLAGSAPLTLPLQRWKQEAP